MAGQGAAMTAEGPENFVCCLYANGQDRRMHSEIQPFAPRFGTEGSESLARRSAQREGGFESSRPDHFSFKFLRKSFGHGRRWSAMIRRCRSQTLILPLC
jgi:hypothetical protein